MGIIMLYITFPNEEEAQLTAEKIIKEKLAACCNIISNNALSIYYWKGEINRDRETIMIAKTSENKVEKLTDRIIELHSYDIPCVVALSVQNGNDEFIDWVKREVNDRSL